MSYKINYIKSVYLFNDEFTNFLDTQIGLDAIALLTSLNYEVKLVNHAESGRAFLSKGLLKQAKDVANKNVKSFKNIIFVKILLIISLKTNVNVNNG
mgnify:CR=1 FL=1